MSRSNSRTPLFVLIALCLLLSGIFAVSTAQDARSDDNDGTRGAFFATRPTPTPKPGGGPPPDNTNKGGNKTGGRVSPEAIGLGYTLYMRDKESDSAVRVDPSREFKSGDEVRIVLEANKNSFLYVFNVEEGGQPVMIFPDLRLRGGNNRIVAHALYEVPSSMEPDPRLQWFVFDEKSGKERLYIVVSRRPLLGVPTGEALVRYCQGKETPCTWRPTPATWAKITSGSKARVMVSKSKEYGQRQTPEEMESTTRGLGLAQDAPAPSVVRMSASAKGNMLVTVIDLVHK